MDSVLFNRLSIEKIYTRKELLSHVSNSVDAAMPSNSFSWILKKELAAGRLLHVGRNRYSLNPAFVKDVYTYTLSKPAEKILTIVRSAFPLVSVLIWEARQYNEFLNHQIGMNTIFLEVEKMFVDAVYELLDTSVKVPVLVHPAVADFIRYQKENTVVLIRKTSESPALKNNPYLPSLEKLLVDMKANKYLRSIISPAEMGDVYSQVYGRYLVSTSTLKRYAMRRTAWEKVEAYLPPESR
ncbi:MAG TPA: hypothetical protein O0X50_00620 [Methanocorpusculum sp.]|nr:hypothetical protein [Methanocorpusculum sp.]